MTSHATARPTPKQVARQPLQRQLSAMHKSLDERWFGPSHVTVAKNGEKSRQKEGKKYGS